MRASGNVLVVSAQWLATWRLAELSKQSDFEGLTSHVATKTVNGGGYQEPGQWEGTPRVVAGSLWKNSPRTDVLGRTINVHTVATVTIRSLAQTHQASASYVFLFYFDAAFKPHGRSNSACSPKQSSSNYWISSRLNHLLRGALWARVHQVTSSVVRVSLLVVIGGLRLLRAKAHRFNLTRGHAEPR
jgi:hypothetical protein